MSWKSLVPHWWRALGPASLGSRPPHASGLRRSRPPRQSRLYLEGLEGRLAPATASYNAGLFTLNGLAAAANIVTVSTLANDSVRIALGNGDTFTSAPSGT